MAVESFTGFIDDMLEANIGKEGRKYVSYIFSLFMFILFANLLGLLPIGVLGLHPFTFTSHFTVTGVLAILSFSIVLIVGFWKHGIKFFTLFVPHGTPAPMILPIALIEFFSFMIRPFSLALRLFVAMMAGHVLLKVLSSFVAQVINAAKLRTRPIMITALALVLGSAVILTDPTFQGMAISLLFGVFVSTLLTLIVVPLGCMLLGERMFQCAGVGDPAICADSKSGEQASAPPISDNT